MKFIKLDAIDSTNDFLRKLSQNQALENFTIVTANSQWKGKGQMGSKWTTEEGKNLITSILIKNTISELNALFTLNIAVALSIHEALSDFKIPNLTIKWPNDIMSGNKKIGGILIENNIKSNQKIESIIGIGLNINQENFEDLPKATSLKVVTNSHFDIEEVLLLTLKKLENNIQYIDASPAVLWNKYHEVLFKIGKPMAFETPEQQKFMGIIQKVNSKGQLEVILEDDTIKTYGIKEITLLY